MDLVAFNFNKGIINSNQVMGYEYTLCLELCKS